jgi:hypothetical protein
MLFAYPPIILAPSDLRTEDVAPPIIDDEDEQEILL